MTFQITIRCEKCGKILQGKVDKAGKMGECPGCGNRLVLPDPGQMENRKYNRVAAPESRLIQALPEALTKGGETAPRYRIMYTEVSPVNFITNRTTHVPMLDLSEGGMGILVRADEAAKSIVPGTVFIAELDFPIFEKPIFVEAEVCWMRQLSENNLLHLGIRFRKTDDSLQEVIKALISYVSSKSNSMDFDKWGAFG